MDILDNRELVVQFLNEIRSATRFEINLFGSQRKRLVAYIERLNADPFFEEDQFDPENDDDIATTIGGLLDYALRMVEQEDGVVSDAFGNLGPLS